MENFITIASVVTPRQQVHFAKKKSKLSDFNRFYLDFDGICFVDGDVRQLGTLG